MRSVAENIRIKWNIHEVVLLTDLYLKTNNLSASNRSIQIHMFSNVLRNYALENDRNISESYRNFNGISMRLANIEYLFSNGEKGLSSFSKLDEEVYNLYMDNYSVFEGLLDEAKRTYKIGNNDKKEFESIFLKWMNYDQGLDLSLSEAYIRYLELVSNDYNNFNYEIDSVFSINTSKQLEVFIEYLNSNDEFIHANLKTYSSISKALKLYLKFLIEKNETLYEKNKNNRIPVKMNCVSSEDNKYGDLRRVNFLYIENYKHTIPKQLVFYGETYAVRNWTEVYVILCELLVNINEKKFVSIVSSNIFYNTKRSYFSIEKEEMIAPKKLSNALYVETNFSATRICQLCSRLLKYFDIQPEHLNVYYIYKNKDQTDTSSVSGNNEYKAYENHVPDDEKDKKTIHQLKEVLKTSFKNGFRINSSLELKKLKTNYKEKFNFDIPFNDKNIEDLVQSWSIVSGKKAYLPETILNTNVRDCISGYIYDCFNKNASVIFYSSIFNRFEKQLLGSKIYNSEMLKNYLNHYYDSELCFKGKYLTSRLNQDATPYDSVKSFAIKRGGIVSYTDFEKNCEYVPLNEVKHIVATHTEFIFIERGHYIHIKNVYITADELEKIRKMISGAIKEYGYISGTELLNFMKDNMTDFLEKNEAISHSTAGIRDSVKYFLGSEYSFNGNLISEIDSEISMAEIYAKFCKRQSAVFTIDQLQSLRMELGSNIYFDSVYNHALRISQNEFVPKDNANFDVVAVDEAINEFCLGAYIPIKQINQFASFPGVDFPWNSFLLEHYVYSYSEEFMLLHTATFNATKSVGVIVRRSSGYSSFEDIIVDLLSHLDIVLNRKSVLNYLFDNGYIARRKLSEIDNIIRYAKQNRNAKE